MRRQLKTALPTHLMNLKTEEWLAITGSKQKERERQKECLIKEQSSKDMHASITMEDGQSWQEWLESTKWCILALCEQKRERLCSATGSISNQYPRQQNQIQNLRLQNHHGLQQEETCPGASSPVKCPLSCRNWPESQDYERDWEKRKTFGLHSSEHNVCEVDCKIWQIHSFCCVVQRFVFWFQC